ncbi:hypothetical protein P691DRAFT_69106 [Macrolepiota fuliginosa MF-IS2]|uniref:Uncharacterized protein n=1 Tax=Macrolepiota fuliginosa MF-IS2 TaxID=1400762 RepID=A0A9P6C171_9AGAR|nr:hypothetical protein P691DRAFT_69106 [Macrolepiota fuliginosa MF-IS2]
MLCWHSPGTAWAIFDLFSVTLLTEFSSHCIWTYLLLAMVPFSYHSRFVCGDASRSCINPVAFPPSSSPLIFLIPVFLCLRPLSILPYRFSFACCV